MAADGRQDTPIACFPADDGVKVADSTFCVAQPTPLLLYSRYINIDVLVSVELLPLKMKNRHGHWICWVSTGADNHLMRRTHTFDHSVLDFCCFAP